jgi:hypothetical protein
MIKGFVALDSEQQPLTVNEFRDLGDCQFRGVVLGTAEEVNAARAEDLEANDGDRYPEISEAVLLTANDLDKARGCILNLESLIDDEDDELGEILGGIVDFLKLLTK